MEKFMHEKNPYKAMDPACQHRNILVSNGV